MSENSSTKKMDKEKQVEWNKKRVRMKIKTKFNEVETGK